MNPYLPTATDCEPIALPATRTSWTYLEAAVIGSGIAFVAPFCNATYCDLVLGMPFSTTIWGMLTGMVPVALFCVVGAIGCSVFMPRRLSQLLSRHQSRMPGVIISILFSVYFGMLGFGFVRGFVSAFGYTTSYYVLAPALIAGFGTWLHIVVRPYIHRPLPSPEVAT